MNGEPVATWFWTRTGASGLRYHDAWIASPHSRPLSLSLPITLRHPEIRGPQVERFFDNLLPDNDTIRRRMQQRYGAASTAAADLLAVLGGECVGAVQLLPAGSTPPDPRALDAEPLTESQIEAMLGHVTSPQPFPTADDDMRVSIAGAQEKTALLRLGKRWHRPRGATPTTHILKLPLGLVGNRQADMTSSVENEWLCAQLLRTLGFRVARTDMARFGDQKALVVERFDRAWMDGRWIARLPQEDLCQALGVHWSIKYESDGGPGIADTLALLGGSAEPDRDRLSFVMTQLAFWLLAALDGHAKNFSIFIEPGGAFRSTPLYDVLSMWPIIGRAGSRIPYHRARLAMALRSTNVHYHLRDIHARHWQALAARSGVRDAFPLMIRLVESASIALDQVEETLPAGFPLKVWEPVRAGVLAQQRRFLASLANGGAA